MAIIDLLDGNVPMRDGEINILNKVNEVIDSINEGGGTINTIEPNEDTTAAKASDSNAIAVGGNSNAKGDNSTSIGWGSLASTTNSVVVGNSAGAYGYNATAIGKGATANGVNSVALGQGSVTDTQNTVSVGTSSATRRIVNVSAPEDNTDAVNKKYADDAFGIASRMQATTLDITVKASTLSYITVSRTNPLDGQPIVLTGITATDGSSWYGNVTTAYRVVDSTTIYVYVNNPNSVAVNCNISVVIIETGE